MKFAAILSGFAVAYALAVVAGRATRLAGGEVALVWPAAAVAIIWLLATRRCSRWQRVIHVVMMGVLTFVMNVVTGAPAPLSAWFVLVNIALSLVTVEVLSYRRDQVVLRDPADLTRLLAAVVMGTVCAALLAAAFLASTSSVPLWETFVLFAVRNGASALLGLSIWLRLRDVRWGLPPISVLMSLEAITVALCLAFVFYWVFWLNTGVPMAFLTLVVAAWLTLRYTTTVSMTFLAVAGAWIIYATLLDKGVFIVPDVQERAMLSQAMVCSLTVIVLTLALYRDSRALLITQLEAARDQADQDSELLAAVLDSIHDSVILVDPSGDVVLENARATADGHIVHHVASALQFAGPPHSVDESSPGNPVDVVLRSDPHRIAEVKTAPLLRQAQFQVVAFRDVTSERMHARALREARDLFAGVLQAASEQAIIGTDPNGRITVFNNGAERLLGWSQAEMLGRTPLDFHLPSEIRRRAEELGTVADFQVFVRNVTPAAAEVREWTYVRRDGTRAAVSLAVSQMTTEDGRCAGYIGVATDITERRAAEQKLAESEERFRLAFDTAPMGMFMFEVTPRPSGRVTRCNQAMAGILGRPADDVLGMPLSGLGDSEQSASRDVFTRMLGLRSGEHLDGEVTFCRADGRVVWGAVSASMVAPQGSDHYGICLVEDVTGRKLAEAELRHMASHDKLTGLANRVLFMDCLERALADAAVDDSLGVGLIFLDLDGFKAVNDTWGHAEGDWVLQIVARRIEGSIRSGDTAARLGGDEFAVLCPNVVDVEHLHTITRRLLDELHRPVRLSSGGTYDRLSASGGVAMSHPGCTAKKMLQRADLLMYQAKRNGANHAALSETPEEAALLNAVQLIPELKRALDRQEFLVRFQPVVDLRTGECIAAEALIRWQHPARGLLEPADFLAVLETSRLMPAIGRYVLTEACSRARLWTAPMEAAAIHVNVSGRQLEAGDFCADVLNALEKTGLAPDRLVLELTETHAGRVTVRAREDLERLRRMGVRIAIDDVGAGFSSLSRIVDLPVDILKIDKHFIDQLGSDPRCAAITRAVLTLGCNLGLPVIAEGVETQEQCELLTQWGCELGQGFLFGAAVDEIRAPL